MAKAICRRCRRPRSVTRRYGTCRSCCYSLWNHGRFPVLLTAGERQRFAGCPLSVRLAPLLRHQRQCWENHGIRLRRLAEAGGLTPVEIVCLMADRQCPDGQPDDLSLAMAIDALQRIS